MIKVGPWPEMETALAALAAAEGKVESIKRRIIEAGTVVSVQQRKRADLVRRTADGDEDAPREAIEAKAAIDHAEATASMLTDAIPGAEKTAKEAEAAVCGLQAGIYWSETRAAEEAYQKAVDEEKAARERRFAAGKKADLAKGAAAFPAYVLLQQAKAGERLDSFL